MVGSCCSCRCGPDVVADEAAEDVAAGFDFVAGVATDDVVAGADGMAGKCARWSVQPEDGRSGGGLLRFPQRASYCGR
jgi:hypothetical protein